MSTASLCLCGIDTVLVTVIAVIITVVYGELIARLAMRRAPLDHARHRESVQPRHRSERR